MASASLCGTPLPLYEQVCVGDSSQPKRVPQACCCHVFDHLEGRWHSRPAPLGHSSCGSGPLSGPWTVVLDRPGAHLHVRCPRKSQRRCQPPTPFRLRSNFLAKVPEQDILNPCSSHAFQLQVPRRVHDLTRSRRLECQRLFSFSFWP